MSQITNHTPFSAGAHAVTDPKGCPWWIIIVRATFLVPDQGPPRPIEKPFPVVEKDLHYGDPATTSLRYDSDLAWEKPRVDVLVNGQAHAPKGGTAEHLLVSFRVGDVRKELVVSGDRFWKEKLLGHAPSAPKPFRTLPVIWERAFGGADPDGDPKKRAVDVRNPVGVGFRGALSENPDIATQLPNVEHRDQLIQGRKDVPEPAGFGALSRNFEARRRYAGSYDEKWLSEHWPHLPGDFDARFFQAAPADQQLAQIKGGEVVETLNLTPDGPWRFTLPALDVPVRLRYADRGEVLSLRTDTVLLEPEVRQVTLVARARTPFVRNRGPLKEVVLGHVRPLWWRAAVRRKYYTNTAGKSGVLVGVPCYKV
ncbi:MAG TPA: DUF2169 domain-containing protein [Planctomycetota bacterium]|nr:DUF2169 domain-containing protein [Planctomycetota bacterium]